MLYKLYKNVFRTPPPVEQRKLFTDLYKQHGVELIGIWKSKENPLVYYMLTKYNDEGHYKQFIENVKKVPEYQEMTNKINEIRISSKVVDLIEE